MLAVPPFGAFGAFGPDNKGGQLGIRPKVAQMLSVLPLITAKLLIFSRLRRVLHLKTAIVGAPKIRGDS